MSRRPHGVDQQDPLLLGLIGFPHPEVLTGDETRVHAPLAQPHHRVWPVQVPYKILVVPHVQSVHGGLGREHGRCVHIIVVSMCSCGTVASKQLWSGEKEHAYSLMLTYEMELQARNRLRRSSIHMN